MTVAGLFAGIDVSTQGCKLVVIDRARAAVVHLDSLNYDRDLPHYETRDGAIQGLDEGVSESDPRMWIEAVTTLLQRLSAADLDAGAIRCISVSGQQHGLVALDRNGALARPRAKLWNDFSTAAECDQLTAAVGGDEAMIAAVGNSQRTGYTAGKVLHLVQHEPEAYARTAMLLVVHNYINWFLTGGVAAMEPGDASGTAMWHPVHKRWAPAVLDAIAPDVHTKLPPVLPADATIGAIDPALARRFGLAPGCRIDAGCGDNMYGAVGTGNYRTGIVTVSLGTSGTAATYLEEPFVDSTGEIAAYCDSTGHYLPLLCVSNMANGYNAFLRDFATSHEGFNTLLADTPPGNDGRILVPWYEGERTPDLPDAAPVYFGFTADDFVPRRLARAVLEGHVHSLYSGYRRFPRAAHLHVTGGLAQSPAWCQMLADVFQVEAVPVAGEGAALGAAIHAAWVWQKENGADLSIADVGDPFIVLEEDRRARPRPESAATYRAQRRLYQAVADRTRGLAAEDPRDVRAELEALP